MRIRVVNAFRWRRVKITICAAAWLIAIGCAGGLESQGTEPIPSIEGFILSMAVCVAMLINIIRTDQARRHGR